MSLKSLTQMRRHKLYIPPIIIQAIDQNGQITPTRALGDDGNIMRTSVGQLLEVPGAPAAFNAAQAMQARDLDLTHPAKDGDDSGGASSGGNPGACEKNDDHGSKAAVRDNELYKEGNAEAETRQKELKRAKRAKRNTMEREEKRERRYKPSRVPSETFKKALSLPTKVMKARRTLVMEQATGLGAVCHQFGAVSACKPLIV